MRTVSFYSYKGGTGRTLLVANVGLLAARLGLKVIAVDLDLEAPGLPYKFPTEDFSGPGVIEWLEAPRRPDIEDLVQTVALPSPFVPGGYLGLVTATDRPSRRYLQAMREVQEGPLSGDATEAAVALVELKESIADAFAPDLLLLDSRTGITTTNAITTRVLADDIAVLTLNSTEQLEGTREVLRSLTPLRRPLDDSTPLGLYVVVSRVPKARTASERSYTEEELRIIDGIDTFLTEPAVPLATTISSPRITLLHNDADVAEREQLLMSRDDALSSVPLHRDYVSFFGALAGSMLNERVAMALDSVESRDQAAQRMRFFGLADSIGERGEPQPVPEALFDPKDVIEPTLRDKVQALLGRPTQTSAQRMILADTLVEYGKALLQVGAVDDARQQFDEAIAQYRSVVPADLPTPTGAADAIRTDEAVAIGHALALVSLADAEKMNNESAVAIATLNEALGVLDAAHGTSLELTELGAQIRCMQAILLTQTGDFDSAATSVETALSSLFPKWHPQSSREWYEPRRDPHHKGGQGAATMLDLLATIYARSSSHGIDDAVATARAATKMWRRYLEGENTERNEVGYAKSLNNLGSHLRVMGELVEAERLLSAATGILRRRAADNLTHVSALATALESLAAVYGDLGQDKLALSTAEEALHFRRDAQDANADDAKTALASALNNVSAQYGALEMHAAAAELAQEAADLLNALPASAARDELRAAALNNLALSRFRDGDARSALPAAEEAVVAQEAVTLGPPQWQKTQLVRTLMNLSLIARGAEDDELAVVAARRAAEVARTIASTQPALYANAVAVLSSRSLQAGAFFEAADSAREAIALFRQLAASDEPVAQRDQHLTPLAATLDTLAIALSAVGDEQGASAAAAESKKIFSSTLRELRPED